MKLFSSKLAELIELIVTVEADSLGCDECCSLLDQFIEMERRGVVEGEWFTSVRIHIRQCKCCRDEYGALLTALEALLE